MAALDDWMDCDLEREINLLPLKKKKTRLCPVPGKPGQLLHLSSYTLIPQEHGRLLLTLVSQWPGSPTPTQLTPPTVSGAQCRYQQLSCPQLLDMGMDVQL